MPWPSCSRIFRPQLRSRLAAIDYRSVPSSPKRARIIASQAVEHGALVGSQGSFQAK